MRGYEKDIPFAISLAVNLIAKKATADLRANLRDDGIHDRTGWARNHIAIWKFSTKKDPTAIVMSPDSIMKASAEGGQRRFPGLVPVVGDGGARATIMSVIRPDLKKNANVLERLLTQKARSPRGATRFIRRGNTVYERTGPATKRRRGTGPRLVLSGPLLPVFRIPRAGVTIRPVWRIERRIAIVQARWGLEIMAEAVGKAIKTSLPR